MSRSLSHSSSSRRIPRSAEATATVTGLVIGAALLAVLGVGVWLVVRGLV
ncbi:MAG: hypothetical protein HZC55_22395 [Verrucomicrobia bacterium]|nr:hypothetical protein [Verrucomicrobiota bacterium]